MDGTSGSAQARAVLGEEYPALLERLRNLLERGAVASELLDAIVPAVAIALERERRSRRRALQAQGIAEAKARGVRFGSEKIQTPANFRDILEMQLQRKITVKQAARICGCSIKTFYRMKREFVAEKQD